VTGTENGLGYFGLSYLEQNADQLNAVEVDGGDGCVAPSSETVQDGSYKPLSRPIFMYPSAEAMAKPHVKAFMEFIVENHQAIAEAAAIVPMTEEQAAEASSALQSVGGGA
jgi:phosphate transport system substrate-binding protein